jgi:hypothetical protein
MSWIPAHRFIEPLETSSDIRRRQPCRDEPLRCAGLPSRPAADPAGPDLERRMWPDHVAQSEICRPAPLAVGD